MDIGNLFKKKERVESHSTFGLTPLGKTKSEEYSQPGPKWQVLSILDDNGPSSINEISEEMHCQPTKTRAILRVLIKNGYIRKVGQEE